MLKFIKPNGAKWLQNLQEPYFGDNPLEEKNLFATTIYSEINTLSLNMWQVVIYVGPPQATVLRLSPPQTLLLLFAQQRQRQR